MTSAADAQPVLIVVAGPNGAGKTTLTREILNHEWIEGCVYVNPDDPAINTARIADRALRRLQREYDHG